MAAQSVAVRQQATEASSEGSRRGRAVRSCQAASHRDELGGGAVVSAQFVAVRQQATEASSHRSTHL